MTEEQDEAAIPGIHIALDCLVEPLDDLVYTNMASTLHKKHVTRKKDIQPVYDFGTL